LLITVHVSIQRPSLSYTELLLQDNLGNSESFSVVCAFNDGYVLHEQVKNETGDVIETASFKMDLVFVTNKTWSASFNETQSDSNAPGRLLSKAGKGGKDTVCNQENQAACCVPNAINDVGQNVTRFKDYCNDLGCKQSNCEKIVSRRLLTTNEHMSSAQMHSLRSPTIRVLDEYDFAGKEFNDVLRQYTKLEPITTGAVLGATNLEDVAVCGANSYSVVANKSPFLSCKSYKEASCDVNDYYDTAKTDDARMLTLLSVYDTEVVSPVEENGDSSQGLGPSVCSQEEQQMCSAATAIDAWCSKDLTDLKRLCKKCKGN
jgi:hypothetical protein